MSGAAPKILSDADDTRGLAIGCTMGRRRLSGQALTAGHPITLGPGSGPSALDPTGQRVLASVSEGDRTKEAEARNEVRAGSEALNVVGNGP